MSETTTPNDVAPMPQADPPAPLPMQVEDAAIPEKTATPSVLDESTPPMASGEPVAAASSGFVAKAPAATKQAAVNAGPGQSKVLGDNTSEPQAANVIQGSVNPRFGTLTVNWVNDLDPNGDGNLVQARAQWAELSPEAKDVLRREIRRLTGQLHAT